MQSGLTDFLFDRMGGSVLTFELEVGRRDGYDLTGLGFTGASLNMASWPTHPSCSWELDSWNSSYHCLNVALKGFF